MNRARIRLGFIVLLSSLSYSNARADSDEAKAAELADSAYANYRAENYLKAMEEFYEAYKILQAPELCYNAARGAEKALLSDRAIELYTEFLDLRGTLAEQRIKARASLTALKAERGLRNAPAGSAAPKDQQAESAAPKDKTDQAPVASGGTGGDTPPPAREKSEVLGVGKWVSAAAAVASLGAGTALLLSGLGDESTVQDSIDATGSGISPMTQAEAQGALDDAARKKLFGAIAIGAGVGLGVLSSVLFAIDGGSEDPDNGHIAVSPHVTGSVRGLLVSGLF